MFFSFNLNKDTKVSMALSFWRLTNGWLDPNFQRVFFVKTYSMNKQAALFNNKSSFFEAFDDNSSSLL